MRFADEARPTPKQNALESARAPHAHFTTTSVFYKWFKLHFCTLCKSKGVTITKNSFYSNFEPLQNVSWQLKCQPFITILEPLHLNT